jgi:hypothetical protein
VTWDESKGGKFWKTKRREEDETKSFVLKKKKEELDVLTIKNHRLCFEIAHILSVSLGIFFNKKWDYTIIWIFVSIIQRNTNLYNVFYVHLLCGFLVVLDYDEMNCNLVFGISYNVL